MAWIAELSGDKKDTAATEEALRAIGFIAPPRLNYLSRMTISTAFEVTPEDVQTLMANHGHPVEAERAEELFRLHILRHAGPGGRIERSALAGDGLDEQTEYAQEDMACILISAGVLPAPC